jgi:chemotaxis methyl-accepting protein methylase
LIIPTIARAPSRDVYEPRMAANRSHHGVRFAGAPPSRTAGRTLARRSSVREATPQRRGAEADETTEQLLLAAWLLRRAGLDPAAYLARPLQRRVTACLRALGAASPEDAKSRVTADPALLAPGLSVLLIGVTQFFRDPDVFDALATHVVPRLPRERALRVWSAGCSTGEELLSVGILLAESDRLGDADLLGTDCRPDAIAEARRGPGARLVAQQTAARDSSLDRTLNRVASRAVSIEARLSWKVADFLRETEPGPWDVIFWRNAAIYLERDAAASVYARLLESLNPGGFLVLGKAERPPAGVALDRVAPCIYRRGGSGGMDVWQ